MNRSSRLYFFVITLFLISSNARVSASVSEQCRLYLQHIIDPPPFPVDKIPSVVAGLHEQKLKADMGRVKHLAVVFGEGAQRRLLFGEAEIVPLDETRFLVALVDRKGRMHLLDPTVQGMKFYDGESLEQDKERTKLMTSRSRVEVEEKELKERFCGKIPKLKPQAEKTLDRLLAKTNKTKLMTTLAKSCLGSGGLWAGTDKTLDKLFYSEPRTNLYAEHRSNLNWGVMGMIVFHNCLATMSPAHSAKLLAAGLGMYVAGNTYFEIGLGQPDLNGEPVKTDYGDFVSGSAGILLYALYGRNMEKSLNANFREFCK